MKALKSVNGTWTLDEVSSSLVGPSSTHPDFVRVKMMLAGLCRTDIMAMQGKIPVEEGRVLGHEGSGVVDFIPETQKEACAKKGIHLGSRVALFPFFPCEKCARTHEIEACRHNKALGIDIDGLFAPHVYAPVSVLFPAPPRLSWRHLAYAEPVAAAMAVTKIHELKKPRVAVLGSGRIATLTKQVLDAFRDDDVPVFEHEVLGENWDAFVETRANSDLLTSACLALKPGGLLVIKSRPQELVPWPHALVTMRGLRLLGAPYGSFAQGLQWMSMGRVDVSAALGTVFEWTEKGIQSALETEKNSSEKAGKLFFNIGDLSAEELHSVVS